MHTADPARQMALVGESRVSCDFGQPRPPVANKLDRSPQPQMDDVAVRSKANRLREYAGKMERAARRYSGEGGNLDGLVEMRDDILLDPF